MDGPRTLRAEELPSLSQLVDTVFRGKPDQWMFEQFPSLFCEANLDNLFVYVEDGVVVSHAGMTQGWASLAGCGVKVAFVGAVATYESCRGRGLASNLFARACDKARADGVDIMMISGGKGLYRAAGAADVGCDSQARVDAAAAAALADARVTLRAFRHTDLPLCAVAYSRKIAHFVRSPEDWETFLRTRAIQRGEQTIHMALRDGLVCGYLVVSEPDKHGRLSVVEFAGDENALAASADALLRKTGASFVEFHVQPDNAALRARLAGAGVELKPVSALGTLLLINFNQLMERLEPFWTRAGASRGVAGLRFIEKDGAYQFVGNGSAETVTSTVEAAQRVFGCPDGDSNAGPLGLLPPAPALWYGLNYI